MEDFSTMMKKQFSQERYSTPVLVLKRFADEDVIRTSETGDNLGGIPGGWSGVTMQGGDFE